MSTTYTHCTDRIIKVQGAARTGKTQVLIDRCIALLDQGIEPAKILVVTSTGMAGQAFQNRLVKAADDELEAAARGICIKTPLELCTDVLNAPGAEKFTGRHPRVLNNAEYKFLQEDLRVIGASNRKIKSALSYYFCQMGKLAPRSEWVLLGEEHTIIKYLESTLISRRAVLEREVAPLAFHFLSAEEGKNARHMYDYVLCDDFQNMDIAQQNCVCMNTGTQLIVAGNPNETVALGTTTPNPQGFIEFEKNRQDVHVITLETVQGNQNVARLANSLVQYGDMNPEITAVTTEREGDEPVLAVKWDSPEKEMDAMTKYLRMEINAIENAHESDTVILVPNRRWARSLNKVLHQRGFETTMIGTDNQLGGDPRDTQRCRAQIAYTKLCLLADPTDTVAWRSWVGFGNFLTNSDLWAKLQDLTAERNMTMLEGLEFLSNQAVEPFPKAHVLGQQYKRAQEFIKKDAKRRGFALMKAIQADKLPEFEDVMKSVAGDETAQQLLDMCRCNFQSPVFPHNPHVMRIMLPQNMVGLEADNVYVFGCVDGFYPSRDAFEVVSTDEKRSEILNNERRAFYSAIAKANDKLVLSYFSKSDLELAEKSKMQVMRVKSGDGDQRIALLRMSQYLQEAGDAYPGTTSGQQLLAEYHLD